MASYAFETATDTNHLPFGFVYTQDMTTADAMALTWTLSPGVTAVFTGSIQFNQSGMALGSVVGGLVQTIQIGNVDTQEFTLQAFHLDVSAVDFFADVQAGNGTALWQLLSSGDDGIGGSAFKDKLTGGIGNDRIDGGGGNDKLLGGSGDDWLSGALGNDILTGGSGADTFSFNTALSATKNLDTITDFKPGTDHFELSASPIGSPFNALFSTDVLMDTEFLAGTAPTTIHQHILYDQTTGTVFYDVDGSGHKHAVAFAQVTPGLHLHATDFLIV